MIEKVREIFSGNIIVEDNLVLLSDSSSYENQEQTNKIFSEKWQKAEEHSISPKIEDFQKKWYLRLYGFDDLNSLKSFLRTKRIIFDAGCGLGYKAAWFAKLAPESIVIAMDYSESVFTASRNYKYLKNLLFVRGDIANTQIRERVIDFVNCDQVIHHTENPDKTFQHLSDLIKPGGEFACYVYAKKALPRELLDDYFREFSKQCTTEEIWDLSKSITILGKTLSELNVQIDVPDIPLLQIKGGNYDLQRFIYWNFLKCFWNEEMGFETSLSTNFDWYAPSNAKRFSEEEFKNLVETNFLSISYFHKEEACYSGRFKK